MMKRAAGPYPQPKTNLPQGMKWVRYEEKYLPSYFETLSLAFQNLPGAFVSELAAIHERNQNCKHPVELLLFKNEVIAFVRVEVSEKGGEISALGRHPYYRSMGLGEHILYRGLQILDSENVPAYTLEVAAKNIKAIGLYEQFGLEIHKSFQVYSRIL